MGTHVGPPEEDQAGAVRVLFTRCQARRGPSKGPPSVSGTEGGSGDGLQPGIRGWEAPAVEEGGEAGLSCGHSRGVEATLRGEGRAAARVCLGSEESSGPQGGAGSARAGDWTQRSWGGLTAGQAGGAKGLL